VASDGRLEIANRFCDAELHRLLRIKFNIMQRRFLSISDCGRRCALGAVSHSASEQ